MFCWCVKWINHIVRAKCETIYFKIKYVRFSLSKKSRVKSSFVFIGKFAVLYRKSVGIMSIPAQLHVYCKRFVASKRIFYPFRFPYGVILYVNSTILPPRRMPCRWNYLICFPECVVLSELKNDYYGAVSRGNIEAMILPRSPLTDAIPKIDTRHVPGFRCLAPGEWKFTVNVNRYLTHVLKRFIDFVHFPGVATISSDKTPGIRRVRCRECDTFVVFPKNNCRHALSLVNFLNGNV